MIKSVLILAMLAAVAFARPEREYRAAFVKFIKDNKKHYAQSEFNMRYNVFKSNMDFVDAWNAQDYHEVGINKFADLTVQEFSKIYNGMNYVHNETMAYEPSVTAATVDWTTKGAVTGVKDQGQCGSCWSFSSTGGLEGAHFIAKNALVSLSEQNLIDCSTAQGNQGCDGGLMTQAFQYIKSNHGIDTEASYPYTATGPNACKFKVANVGSTITGWTNIKSGSEADLVTKITAGPTSVAIDASHSSFQLYTSGIYYEPACSSSALDHGVLAVGFGTDGSKDYYKVKNSWGVSWGNAGYILMSRNRNNNCGIATMATLPTDS
jgi:cathepsin L